MAREFVRGIEGEIKNIDGEERDVVRVRGR